MIPAPISLLNDAVERHRAGDLNGALARYDAVLALAPDAGPALHLRGVIAARLGRPADGLTWLGRARRLDPTLDNLGDNVENVVRIAAQAILPALAQGDVTAAIGLLRRMADLPLRIAGVGLLAYGLANAVLRYGLAWLDGGNVAAAVALQAALPADWCAPPAEALLLATVLRRLGRPSADVTAVLQRAAVFDRDDAGVRLALAQVYQEQGDGGAVAGCCHEACLIALGKFNGYHFAEAEDICRAALAVCPGLLMGRIVLGVVLNRGGRSVEAATLLREAVAADPVYSEIYRHYGESLLALGRNDQAAAVYRAGLALDPVSPEMIGGLGLADYARGDDAAAAPRLARALRLKGALSAVSSAAACIHLRRAAPAAPFPRRAAVAGARALSVSCLNRFGRFAHNIYDYLTVRLYAEKYGLAVETPEWVGGLFFDLDDPPLTAPRPPVLRRHAEFRAEFLAGLEGRVEEPLHDVDVFLGWTLYDVVEKAASRDAVRRWLRPRPVWTPYLAPALDRLRAAGETIVAVHIRRTDRAGEATPSLDVYRQWLGEMWDSRPRPVLFLATDDVRVRDEFAAFAPKMLGDLTPPWRGLEHLQDFFLLGEADAVALSAGGFARTAAALNPRDPLVVQPNSTADGLERAVFWSN